MLTKLKSKTFTWVASLAYLVALTEISTNSFWVSYQPEIPEELQR
ncbi:cyclic lactone autoinducer peptide [Aneurinibacillus migulanus]|nr:cyclic lactone autoinducer peptide [Aneurinibacillus migulanus]MCP1356120.1 cyclic lactone autoinducer peptide [Aneurinibacillus migulanus]MED4729446.1 cyclic lactone autoinducer peptide [Aneurinibacillus migulanus]